MCAQSASATVWTVTGRCLCSGSRQAPQHRHPPLCLLTSGPPCYAISRSRSGLRLLLRVCRPRASSLIYHFCPQDTQLATIPFRCRDRSTRLQVSPSTTACLITWLAFFTRANLEPPACHTKIRHPRQCLSVLYAQRARFGCRLCGGQPAGGAPCTDAAARTPWARQVSGRGCSRRGSGQSPREARCHQALGAGSRACTFRMSHVQRINIYSCTYMAVSHHV